MGRPSRTTSVMTATIEVVISEKSKLELAMFDLSGTARSRMSTIRIWNYPFDPCCSAEREGRCSRSAFRLDGADGRLAR
jgi:hypothetical protein